MKFLVTAGPASSAAHSSGSRWRAQAKTVHNDLDKLTYAGNLENLRSVAGYATYHSCTAISATRNW